MEITWVVSLFYIIILVLKLNLKKIHLWFMIKKSSSYPTNDCKKWWNAIFDKNKNLESDILCDVIMCFFSSQVTMGDKESAERAVKEANPIIDGRKANVNLAYLGAKPRNNTQNGQFYSYFFFLSFSIAFSLLGFPSRHTENRKT